MPNSTFSDVVSAGHWSFKSFRYPGSEVVVGSGLQESYEVIDDDDNSNHNYRHGGAMIIMIMIVIMITSKGVNTSVEYSTDSPQRTRRASWAQ